MPTDPWAFYYSVDFCLASNLFLFFVSLQVMFNHDTISHYLAALCWFCYLVAFLPVFIVFFLLRDGQEIGLYICYPFLAMFEAS